MKKYLIRFGGIDELTSDKATKRHLRKYRYLGKSKLIATGETVKTYGERIKRR
jgi:hypothetical protein